MANGGDVGNGAERVAQTTAWFQSRFGGVRVERKVEPGIYVVENNDPVILDRTAYGPIRIGGKAYDKGLFCHANSHVVVVLPAAGRLFRATAGLDHNDDTVRGRGSVVFSVEVGEKEKYRSNVMRHGTPGESVEVALDGAHEFVLKVGDAGDGISWDQADWAEAKAVLQDGREVWLSDLGLHHYSPLGDWPETPPFSLKVDGKPFVPGAWKRTTRKLDTAKTQMTLEATEGDLSIRCVGVVYSDLPFVEWTVFLTNTGTEPSPMVTEFRALDADLEGLVQGNTILHHHVGSPCRVNDFEPLTTPIGDSPLRFDPGNGRPSDDVLPYFNVEGVQRGITLAVGWPGQWMAEFRRVGAKTHVAAGQETTAFRLLPGETVRSPLIALGLYEGSWIDGQNEWRRWMVAHNIPRFGGKVMPPQHAGCSSHQLNEMLNANEENQKAFLDGYKALGIQMDYWWMDAGWYPNNGGWYNTGTWEVDTKRFPNGLKAISDYARKQGVDTLVWFEPERVNRGTWLYNNRPQWLIGPDSEDPGSCKLLNLGNTEARNWLIDHIDGIIKAQGIDFYRQDYNINPLAFWAGTDAPDRQGITENLYVQGYLAYWDALKKRHPDMPFDTCASGGRRLDLETLRRSVPLLRSDYILQATGNQCHTYGLSFWVPYQGSGENTDDLYRFRSVYLSAMNTVLEVRTPGLNFDTIKKALAERAEIVDCFLGDYYPLMPYTTAEDHWIAWQFDLQKEHRGVIQVFRRPQSVYEGVRLYPRGLEPDATYRVTGNGPDSDVKGASLMGDGILVNLRNRPDSAVIQYKKKLR